MKRLSKNFYSLPTVKLAKMLLGKTLVRNCRGKELSGIITETEAYKEKNDPGSHAFRKRTKRNEPMFGPPGRAYVYFCYGFHHMLNVTSEKEGEAGAVLIRAIEPLRGAKRMKRNRGIKNSLQISNGPGKLCEALEIGMKLNKADLIKGKALYIAEAPKGMKKFRVSKGPRIGIKQGLDKMWRFWIKRDVLVRCFKLKAEN